MTNDSKPEGDQVKRVSVSLSLREDTIAALDMQSAAIDRSRSWMADTVIREKLGLPPTTIGG